VTKISLSNLAVYQTRDDRARAMFFDPLMIKVALIFGPIAAAWPFFGGSLSWALVVLLGALVIGCSATTSVRIATGGVIVERRHLVFREGAASQFHRGVFEADLTTAFEDDSVDPNAFTFRRAGDTSGEICDDWRASNRATALAWLNSQLDRLGLLDTRR